MEIPTRNFNRIVAELVDYYATQKHKSRNDIAAILGVSLSFVNKVHSAPKKPRNERHYNAKHIFLIADNFKIDINSLFPSKENYKLLYANTENVDLWYEGIIEESMGNKDE